jgi:hypothetical protein
VAVTERRTRDEIDRLAALAGGKPAHTSAGQPAWAGVAK